MDSWIDGSCAARLSKCSQRLNNFASNLLSIQANSPNIEIYSIEEGEHTVWFSSIELAELLTNADIAIGGLRGNLFEGKRFQFVYSRK